MPLIYNWQTKRMENAPDEAVTQLVGSGAASFRQGVRIPVIAPDGEAGTIPSDQAGAAFQNGFRFRSAAEDRAATVAQIEQARADAYDMPGVAAAAGALRGVTFGGSDVLARAIGGREVAEGLLQVRERNPMASMVGEVGGTLASMAVPIAPAAQLARLGAATTKATRAAKAISELAKAGKAGEVAAKMLSAGAGSAIEGAAYGLGEVVSEAALGDPNLTAQNAIATFGLNTLLGGVAGGLVEGTSIAASKAWQKAKQLLIDEWHIPSIVGEGYAKAVTKLKMTDPEHAKEFVELFGRNNRDWRESVVHYAENPQEMTDKLAQSVGNLVDTSKVEADIVGSLRESVRASDLKTKFAKSANPAEEIRPVMQAAERVLKAQEKDPTRFVGGLRDGVYETAANGWKAAEKAKTLADLNEALLSMRQELDARFKNLIQKPRRDMRFEEANAKDAVFEIRNEINGLLKDPKLFGEYAGKFAQADEAFSQYLNTMKSFRKAVMREEIVPGGSKLVLDERKLASMIVSPDAERNLLKFDRISELETATRKLAESEGAFSMTQAHAAQVPSVTSGIMADIDQLKKIRSAQLLVSRMESTTGKSLTALMMGGLVGSAASDYVPGGSLMGATAGWFFGNPRSALKYLVKLERANKVVHEATDASIRRFLGLKVPQAWGDIWDKFSPAIQPLAIKETVEALGGEGDDADALKSSIQPLQQMPNLDGKLIEALPRLDETAPGTYAALHNQISTGMAFLQSKVPAETGQSLFAGKSPASDAQMRQLQLYASAVVQPGIIFHELRQGRIHPETVETLQAVYPDLYANLQRQAFEVLSESKEQRISWERQLELSKLLNMPTNPLLANLGDLQASWITGTTQEHTEARTQAIAAGKGVRPFVSSESDRLAARSLNGRP